jgi:ribulose 1,5-bisphosphate synthetase/thiazole synthase
MSRMQTPIVADVDLLVVGGTSAGVAAALEARRHGATVLVVAPRAYLGEDIAGRYDWWDQPPTGALDCELAQAIFAAGTSPPTPMHVKLTLESRLLASADQARPPLVLNTQPAGVVVDRQGLVRGAVIVNRAGRQAVLARQVIDASVEGTLLQLSGHPCRSHWRGLRHVTHVTLCHGPGQDAPGLSVDHLPGFTGQIQGKMYELSARRYTLPADLGDGSPDALARAYAQVVQRCWTSSEYLHQEQLALVRDAVAGADPAGVLNPAAYRLSDGLIGLSPNGPITGTHTGQLERPAVAMAIGTAIGRTVVPQTSATPLNPSELHIRCHGADSVPLGAVRFVNDALRPGVAAAAYLPDSWDQLPRLGRYDVLVVGGGTAGAPAAIAAAAAGARTAVLEPMPALGGVGTVGQITKYWFGHRGGFTQTMDRGVRELEFLDTLKTAEGSWSVAAKRANLHQRCHDLGVALWMRCLCVGVWIEGDAVRGVVAAGPYGYGLLEARIVIDSTGCADIPAAAGAATVAIGAEHAAVQGVGLAGLRPGREYHNTDHNFCDDTDVVDTTMFLLASKRKFRDHFDMGQLVDSRERRQIVGEMTLDPVDFLAQRRFPDTIAVATSNFDTHGYTIHPLFMVKPPSTEQRWVDVPFRCLLPRGLRQVLVTGLGVSAHRDALPVIRMQADLQNQGYAAGRAAAMAAHAGVDVRQIDLRELQSHLVALGCLPQRVLTDVDTFPVDDARLDQAVAQGWDDEAQLALLWADPRRAVPKLQAALAATSQAAARVRCALILALLHDDAGRATLHAAVARTPWDAGWNYRGMGQFGMSFSPLDALLVGLGKVGDADAWPPLFDKALSLRDRAVASGMLPEFSHCRALALAFESLIQRHHHPDAAAKLTPLCELPGMTGHAQTSSTQVLAALTDDPCETEPRNRALRELYLARARYRCGENSHWALSTLRRYAQDLRGHFARHARAVLRAGGAPAVDPQPTDAARSDQDGQDGHALNTASSP